MMASLREWAMFSVVVALLARELAATRQPELLPSSSNATVLLLALLTCVLLVAAVSAASMCSACCRCCFLSAPKVVVVEEEAEREDVLQGRKVLDPDSAHPRRPDAAPVIQCWDPSTMQELGSVAVDTPAAVAAAVERAREAQREWAGSSFAQRRRLLLTLQRFITENAETVARVACRDSGKTPIDAIFGELAVTCEKIRWTIAHGERWLSPEYRGSGLMNSHKTSRVEWAPVGVVGAVVPWNYPFHNVLNPVIAAVFAGNAIVVKASEYAAWSTQYLGRVLSACLEAVGAPPYLVQIVNGFAETGEALVTAGLGKVIFVGSVGVGRAVMQSCASTTPITPLCLELGGKDPFVVCDDTPITPSLLQLACRGVFQNMGQNCAGPERFLVQGAVYGEFCDGVAAIVRRMSQGAPLHSRAIDCGALCMPQHRAHLQRLVRRVFPSYTRSILTGIHLCHACACQETEDGNAPGQVDDALAHGARLLVGGGGAEEGGGDGSSFYPPTVLADVRPGMRIMREEIFGPIMCIVRLPNGAEGDAAAVELANDCEFALSSCAHSASHARAAAICRQLHAGMSAVNDLEGTTYLSQSLPFGGCKSSGFDRFAGPEGLRGLCVARSVVEDRCFAASIPAQLRYPSTGQGYGFGLALLRVLYGYDLSARVRGVGQLIKWSLPSSAIQPPPTGP